MKKAKRKASDELRREYKRSDFGSVVRGKYARRLAERTNVVVLEPEVAKAFPNDRAVNNALRRLMRDGKSATASTAKRRARHSA
jgi:hypothetical protein